MGFNDIAFPFPMSRSAGTFLTRMVRHQVEALAAGREARLAKTPRTDLGRLEALLWRLQRAETQQRSLRPNLPAKEVSTLHAVCTASLAAIGTTLQGVPPSLPALIRRAERRLAGKAPGPGKVIVMDLWRKEW